VIAQRQPRARKFGFQLDRTTQRGHGRIATAAAPGLTAGASNSFHVTARQLVVTTVIANMAPGTSFGITVEARDGNNALAENFTGAVALDAGAPGGANFNGGTANASAVAGVTTFTGLVLSTAANNYILTATSAGVTVAV
jgi:hypothetical protein